MAGKKAKSEAAVEPVEEVTEAVETEQTAEAPKADKPVVKMYIGATLAKYGLTQNTVYEGMPRGAGKLFEACPKGRLLFVEVEGYPEAEKQIRKQEGLFWEAYKQTINIKTGGN